MGLDYYDSDYDSDRSLNRSTIDMPIHKVHIDQQSTGLYADSTTTLGADTTVNLGARLQWIRQDGKDNLIPMHLAPVDNESGAADYDDSHRVPHAGSRH